jgi:hypothetical protein
MEFKLTSYLYLPSIQLAKNQLITPKVGIAVPNPSNGRFVARLNAGTFRGSKIDRPYRNRNLLINKTIKFNTI